MSLSISTSLRLSVTERLALAGTEELLFGAPMLIVQFGALMLKALCHYIRRNCFLMSSLVQKFNQRGPRKYGHAQYLGIVHGSTRTFAEIERVQREDVWHCLRLSS